MAHIIYSEDDEHAVVNGKTIPFPICSPGSLGRLRRHLGLSKADFYRGYGVNWDEEDASQWRNS